jgi:hypothetical protein
MNTYYLTTVRRLFSNPLAPESTNRHNQKAWVKSIRTLGDKWLLAKPVEKL